MATMLILTTVVHWNDTNMMIKNTEFMTAATDIIKEILIKQLRTMKASRVEA